MGDLSNRNVKRAHFLISRVGPVNYMVPLFKLMGGGGWFSNGFV